MATDQEVGGSNPPGRTIFFKLENIERPAVNVQRPIKNQAGFGLGTWDGTWKLDVGSSMLDVDLLQYERT